MATCISRAVCEVCHEEYGELNKDNHKLQHVEAKAATVTQEGNTEYYYCSLCLKYFADSNASKQIDKDSVVTSKLAPEIIAGDKCIIDKNSDKAITFKSNAAFSDFVKVELDGRELVKDKDYTVKAGSIIVTLNPDLIKKLSTGEHVIGIASSSGTASAHFTVKEPETESIKETETETESIKESETVMESTKGTELETESIKESETEIISQIESETTSQYTFDENETNASSINTGDRNHGKLWLVIAIIALAGCIAATVMYVVSKRK